MTALNSRIGYKKAAEIAKKAYKEKRPIIDVAEKMTTIERKELESLLDPKLNQALFLMNLKESKCEACRIDAPLVTESEKTEFMSELSSWEINNTEGIDQLAKVFKFDNYYRL